MTGERVLDALGTLPTDLGKINARVAEIKPAPSEASFEDAELMTVQGVRRLAVAVRQKQR